MSLSTSRDGTRPSTGRAVRGGLALLVVLLTMGLVIQGPPASSQAPDPTATPSATPTMAPAGQAEVGSTPTPRATVRSEPTSEPTAEPTRAAPAPEPADSTSLEEGGAPTRLDGRRIPSGVSTVPDGLEAGEPVPGQYIVALRPEAEPSSVARGFVAQGLRVHKTFTTAARGFAGRMPPGVVRALRNDPRVLRVEPDRVVESFQTQSAPPWGLDRIDQRGLPLSGSYAFATKAPGVSVYVLDTGILGAHEQFEEGVAVGFDAFATGTTEDCNGHGTHVAGTIAGETYGVAKDVRLVPVRVLDCDGAGLVSGVIAGVDWVARKRQSRPDVPAVATMSLGGPPSSTLDTAVRNAISAGVTVVVAAGNESVDACNTSPARVSEAITVGATGKSDSRAAFSNFGSCLDLFAPGVGITSAGISSGSASATFSGTSMAAPHAAGVAALYLATDPDATPAAVSERVVSSATTGLVSQRGAGSPDRLLYSILGSGRAEAQAAPITSLRLTAGVGAATLSWANPSTADFARVEVRRSGGVRAPRTPDEGTLIYSGRAKSFTQRRLAPGRDYSFSVFAFDAAGTSSAPVSAVAYGSQLSVALRPRRVTYTGATEMSGSLTLPGSGETLGGVPVVIQQRPAGTNRWRRLAVVTTSPAGTLRRTHAPVGNTEYRFRFGGAGNILGAFSGVRTVLVRPAITSAFARSGGKIFLGGKVAPSHAGRRVVLQRRADGRWRTVARETLNARSRYRFPLPTSRAGRFTYRVRLAGHDDHLTGLSSPGTLTIR